MLKFNTFRAQRYLRSRFVEGRFLLASEASDLELEILDLLRKTVQSSIGDVAIENAWEVSRLSSTQILVKPGEAWLKGLPFKMRSGKDQQVSGTILTSGIVPVGVTIADDATGLGKIITLNSGGTTPTDTYRIVLTAREEIVTNVEDPFLKNANISETTALKVRLNIRINIVSLSDQTESPVPYKNDTSDENLVNQIVISPAAAMNGELIQTNVITGSEEIDGRDRELIIRNDPGIGGGNPFPNGTTDQQAFFNGKLIDSLGTEYHLNAMFNDTISTRVVLRIDKEVGQPDPQLINGQPYRIVKRDVYATDDVNGSPQGKLFWTIGEVEWHQTNEITHPSKVRDLRSSVTTQDESQRLMVVRDNLKVVGGQGLSFDLSEELLSWAQAFAIVNPYGSLQTIAAGAQAIVDGGSLAYEMNLDSGGAIARGILAVTVSSGGTTATLASVDLTDVRVGNVLKDANGDLHVITAINNVTDTVTAVTAIAAGAATIYKDSFGPGVAPFSRNSFILAVRSGQNVLVGDEDEQEEFEDRNAKLIEGGTWSFGGGGSPVNFALYNTGVNSVALGSAGDSVTWYGQGFTTTSAGNITSAYMALSRAVAGAVGGTITLQIYSDVAGLPGVLLGTSDARLASSINSSFAPLPTEVFTFSTPVAVSNATSYFLVVNFSAATGSPFWVGGQGSDPYAGGQAVSTIDSGGTWTASSSYDFVISVDGTSAVSNALTWANDAYIQVPGLANDRNTILADSIDILDGEVAFVDINRETGVADNLTVVVAAIEDVVANKDLIIIARRIGNDVILGNGTVRLKTGQSSELDAQMSDQNLEFIGATSTADNSPQYPSNNYVADGDPLTEAIGDLDAAVATGAGDTAALSARTNADRNLKLVAGGNWLWTLGTQTLSWSAHAFVNYPGFQNDRNQISAGSIVLLANEVMYVDVNRTTDSATVLTPAKVDIDNFVLTDNRVIIARRVSSEVIVGSHSFRLIDGQSKELDAGLSIQNRALLGTGVTEATSAPGYSGRGAPLRTITDSQGILDAIASADAEVDKFFGQLQIKPHASLNKATMTGADRSMLDSAIISQELNDFLMSFTGAVINFQTGAVLKDDDATPLGINFTPFSIPVGEYFWYGIAAIAAAVTADNRQEIQLQITPAAAANAVQASAPFPLIVGDKKIGAIQVRNNAGSIEVVAIRRLGVGSGSGGGTGDASGPEVVMTQRLLDSDMELLTTILAKTHKDTRIDPGSDVFFDAGSKTYKFENIGDELDSIQMLDADEFLDESLDVAEIELLVFWATGFVDTAATYEVSRDGGNEYQTVDMERVGDATSLYRGRLRFETEASNQLLQSNSLASDDANLVLNATTQQKVSQPFTVSSGQVVKNVDIEINKTGTPSGTFRLALYTDSSGNPGTVLSISGAFNLSTLSGGINSVAIPMPSTPLAAGTYHLVLETDLAYKNSFSAGVHEIAVRVESAGTPVSRIYNGSAWSAGTGQWVYEIEGRLLDLRIKITSSAADVRIDALGILYNQTLSGVATGVKPRQVFTFSGNLNNTEFTLTNFVPDADLLRVYDVVTGLTYRYGAFSLDGQKVIFDSGQFFSPGNLITLVFDQTNGGSYDNSDANAVLLASNHLGSTDPNYDRSVAGRGIFLRRPDGVLRELTIDNTDQVAIYSV